MDQEVTDMIVELTSRVENLENAVSNIAENFTKLEQILDAIANQVIADEDTNN